MKIIGSLLVNGLAVGIAAYLLPGVAIESWQALVVATVVLAILNTLVKPILHLISLPITILTLGLFALVVNGLVVWMAAGLVNGFTIDGLLWAMLFSIVLSLVSTFLNWTVKD